MNHYFQKYGALIALVVLFALSALWKPDTFLNPENLRNIVNQNSYVGMIAIGMTLVIILGGIDLSVGSMVAFLGAVMLSAVNAMLRNNIPEDVAVGIGAVICLAGGTLLGAINGWLITLGKIAPFVATVAGLAAYRSLALVVANGGEVRSESENALPGFSSWNFAVGSVEITFSMIFLVVIAIVATILLEKTRFGRYVVAAGANEKAAIYTGINTNRVKVLTYSFLGFCTGLASFCITSRFNSASASNAGMLWELDAIAAVAIGGTSMAGGRGRIWTTVVGVLIMGIIANMLVMANISAYWQGLVKGIIILLAVLIQRGRKEG